MQLQPQQPGQSPFDAIRHQDEQGEYWLARELGQLLGYTTNYRNFTAAIDRAKIACEQSGIAVEDHFAKTRKMVSIGSGAQRALIDIRLTRYACYLATQNADPEKTMVALGQTYFAVQTHMAEIAEANYLEWRHRAILSYMAKGKSQE
jgi:DNA-damage-inducible protein D